MSASDKPLALHEFTFDRGAHSLQVECRRLPQEVAGVTQTLQLDVEELFANLLDWDTPQASAATSGGGEPAQQPWQQPDSKKLCGNVEADQPDLIGLDVWPAAIALCEYLARRSRLVAGAAVCELGAGAGPPPTLPYRLHAPSSHPASDVQGCASTVAPVCSCWHSSQRALAPSRPAGMGLPGLLCAKLGAASVLLTDYEPVVVDALRRNAALNGVASACTCLSLDWLDLSPLAPAQRAAHDLVLLADVIYAAAVVQPLVAALRALLRPQSGAALVAHRIRRPLVFDRIDKIARLQVRMHCGARQGLQQNSPTDCLDCLFSVGTLAQRVACSLRVPRDVNFACVQERDEIFEGFKTACQAAGLHLHFLNDGPTAQAGDEPLLLAVGSDPDALRREFSAAADAADAQAEGGGGGGRGGEGQRAQQGGVSGT